MKPTNAGLDRYYRPPHYMADWSPAAAIVQDIVGDARHDWSCIPRRASCTARARLQRVAGS